MEPELISPFVVIDGGKDKPPEFDILFDENKYKDSIKKSKEEYNSNINNRSSIDNMISIIDSHKVDNDTYVLDNTMIESNIVDKWNANNTDCGNISIKPKYSNSNEYNTSLDNMINTFGINHINESNLEGTCDSRYLSNLINNNKRLNDYTKHDLIDHIYGDYDAFKFEKDNYYKKQKLSREVSAYTQSQYEFTNAMICKGFSGEDTSKLHREVINNTIKNTRDIDEFKEYLGVENMEQFQRHMTDKGLGATRRNYNVSRVSIENDENINTLELAEKEVNKMCRGHKMEASKMFDKDLDNRYRDLYNVMMENK